MRKNTEKATWARSTPVQTRGFLARQAVGQTASNEDQSDCSVQREQHLQSSSIQVSDAPDQHEAEAGATMQENPDDEVDSMSEAECRELLRLMLKSRGKPEAPEMPAQQTSSNPATLEATKGTKSKSQAAEEEQSRLTDEEMSAWLEEDDASTYDQMAVPDDRDQEEGANSGEDYPILPQTSKMAFFPPEKLSSSFLAPKGEKKETQNGRRTTSGPKHGVRSASGSKMALPMGTLPDTDLRPTGTDACHQESQRAPGANRDSHERKTARRAVPAPEAEAQQAAIQASRNNPQWKATYKEPPTVTRATGGHSEQQRIPRLEHAIRTAMESFLAAIRQAAQPEAAAARGPNEQQLKKNENPYGQGEVTTHRDPREDLPASGVFSGSKGGESSFPSGEAYDGDATPSSVPELLRAANIGDWNQFIVSLESDANKNDIDHLSGRMIEEFRRQQESSIMLQRPRVQKVHHPWRSQPAKDQGHFQDQINHMPGCFLCGSPDHFKADCPKLQVPTNSFFSSRGRGRGGRGGRRGQGRGRWVANTSDAYMIYNADLEVAPRVEGAWMMDSGAGMHIASRIQAFKRFKPISSSVRMANGQSAQVTGIGTIEVPGVGDLKNVLQVPSIPSNLISVMKLCDDKSLEVTFRHDGGQITKHGNVIASMCRRGNHPFLIPKGEDPQEGTTEMDLEAQRAQGAIPKVNKRKAPKKSIHGIAPVMPNQPEAEDIDQRSYADVVAGASAVEFPTIYKDSGVNKVLRNDDIVCTKSIEMLGVLNEDGDIDYVLPVEAVNDDPDVAALCQEKPATISQVSREKPKKKKGPRINPESGKNTQPQDTKVEQGKSNITQTQVKGSTHIEIGKPLHDRCAHILHRKLAHLGFHAVKNMERCTEGLELKGCKVYMDCAICKQTKSKTAPTPKTSTRKANRPYQLIHTDVVGPFPESLGGKKFFLTVVDDFSRFGHVFPMWEKSEVLGHLQYLHRLVETQHGVRIAQIQSDRGSEFTSRAFQNWTKEKGIAHFTTPPYFPAGNGVAERRNGVLQTMKDSLLADANLGHVFWAEAIIFANYTLNRTWSSVVDQTPYSLIYNKKPFLAHLRIFGSKAWVHIPKQMRRKGDPTSRLLIFLGYSPGTKGYRFLCDNKKVLTTNSATFIENSDWSRLHANDISVYVPGTSNEETTTPIPTTVTDTPVTKSKKGKYKWWKKRQNKKCSPSQAEPIPRETSYPQRPGLPASRAGDPGYGEWQTVRRSNRATKGIPPKKLEDDYIGIIF